MPPGFIGARWTVRLCTRRPPCWSPAPPHCTPALPPQPPVRAVRHEPREPAHPCRACPVSDAW